MATHQPAHLVLIDVSKTFDERWTDLPVGGSKRTAELTAAHIDRCGHGYGVIHVTFDTHPWTHMSLARNWRDKDGKDVELLGGIHRLLSIDEIVEEEYRYRWDDQRPGALWIDDDTPGPTLREFFKEYVKEIGHIDLWNTHGIPDMDTWALQPEVAAALNRHALRFGLDPQRIMKGYCAIVDQYGGLQAAKMLPRDPSTGINQRFVQMAMTAGKLVFAGIEGTHCVMSTFLQAVELLPSKVKDMVILVDCVPVLPNFGTPETNYPVIWEQFLADMVKLGVTVTTSDKFRP